MLSKHRSFLQPGRDFCLLKAATIIEVDFFKLNGHSPKHGTRMFWRFKLRHMLGSGKPNQKCLLINEMQHFLYKKKTSSVKSRLTLYKQKLFF